MEELYGLARTKGPVYSLGISAMGSAVGGIIGTILLMVGATGIAALATQFSSFEYFWVAVLGLTAGVFASGGAPLKGLVSLLLGLLFATVGIDPTLGFPRFHFDSPTLLGGLNYIVAMIGLFGFSEVLEHLYRGHTEDRGRMPASQGASVEQFYLRPVRLMLRSRWLVVRSSLLGVFVGFLPGAGADIGAWVASSFQKLTRAKDPDLEQDRTVLAGTISNNAAVASAWIPALSLGLPGDTVTAMVLGVFLMKGITPGPLLFDQNLTLVWTLYLTFILANILLLPFFGFLTARLAALIVKAPFNLLLSVIAGVCVVGAYAINNNPFDVWIMAGMGVVAFLLRRGGFPLAQVVLGMVLGPILEQNFMVSAIKSSWNVMSFFERPLALGLMAATLLTVFLGLRLSKRLKPDEPG